MEQQNTIQNLHRENYYILLELSYDPPVTDRGRILSALHTKKQEWTRQQDNPSTRNIALTNLGLVKDIEQVMLDPSQRAHEVEEALRLRETMLRQFDAELRVLETKGHILPREAGAIAVKYKAYGVDNDLVTRAARCPISETPPETKKKDDTGEVLDRITAKKIQRDLALLGEKSLYTFLGEEAFSSVKKLRTAAEAKSRASLSSGSKSSETTITQELAGICQQLFSSFDSKQLYDRYLKVSQYPELAQLIDDENTRYKHLSPESLLRLVNFGVQTYSIGVLEAEQYIRHYCTTYDISVGGVRREINCPACGNPTDREASACSVCAAPLSGDCPGCGTSFENGPSVCSQCGFKLSELIKGLQHIGEAENALIENNWSSAGRNLQYAHKYWPGHPKLKTMLRRAKRLEEVYAHYVDTISDCVAHNQYYAALDLVREAAGRRMQLPTATTTHVEKTVADFEQKLADLQKGEVQPEYSQLAELTDCVRDSIEINHLMRRYPPEPPHEFFARVLDKRVHLTWDVSPSRGMKDYIVVRKQGSQPLTAYDGDILYEGHANSLIDKTAQPLTEYYYTVYSRRGGTFSETGVTQGPVLIVPEIQNLRILPTDGGAHLTWDYNANIREVIIWRKLGGDAPETYGDGINLENPRLDGYTDSRLRNGSVYWYYVMAVYLIGGEKVISPGICENITPRKLLAPIEDLIIARTDDDGDEYVVNWQGSQHSDVLLFASPRKPVCRKGEMLPLTELIEQYRKLDLDAKQPESARFRHSWNGGIYIFPVSVSVNFATVGEIKYLANVKDVHEPTYDIVGDDMFVNMKWPSGLNEVVVCYRFDRFVKTPDEQGTNHITCTREQYDYDAGVRLQDVEPVHYYITIFSVFRMPDGDKVYSPGVNMLVNNTAQIEVFYHLERTRRLFSHNYTINVTINSDENFVLPKGVIVGKVGRLPLSKSDGIRLFELDRETKVSGSVQFEYRVSSLPDDLYIRLFLQDDSMHESLRMLPTGNLKIT